MASKSHILIFPFMAQGHTIPLLDLSKLLSRTGFKITILTTPSNASTIRSYISQQYYSNIHLKEIPFPQAQDLPESCENMSQLLSPDHLLPFLNATKQLQEPFEKTLEDMAELQDLPVCVVSDSFLGWTNMSCRAFGVPRLVFHGMGVLPMAIKKSVWIHQTHKLANSDTEPVDVKGVGLGFTLTKADLPNSLRESNTTISQFFSDAEISDIGSWGVIANSFTELEKDHVISSLESLYGNDTRVFCVGPLFLYDQIEGLYGSPNPSTEWVRWLNQKEKEKEKSVIYVSFGSQADLSNNQLDELGYGLEMSGHDYFLVVRSKNWNPPYEMSTSKGLIVREWVDQRWVLGHKVIVGFLSHCGWNSVLESLTIGVPILAWPMHAEQHLNAKYLVEELKVGVQVPNMTRDEKRIVRREAICEGVKELMGGERGEKARERAIELGRMARRAVQVGGSSYNNLDKLVDQISHLMGPPA